MALFLKRLQPSSRTWRSPSREDKISSTKKFDECQSCHACNETRMMTTTNFFSNHSVADVRRSLRAHTCLLRLLTWLHMLPLGVSTSLEHTVFPRMLWVTTSLLATGRLLRLKKFDECFIVIVSVARDCRIFACMTLCKDPNVFVSKALTMSHHSHAQVTEWTLGRSAFLNCSQKLSHPFEVALTQGYCCSAISASLSLPQFTCVDVAAYWTRFATIAQSVLKWGCWLDEGSRLRSQPPRCVEKQAPGSHPTSWSAIRTWQHRNKSLMAEDWRLWPKAFMQLAIDTTLVREVVRRDGHVLASCRKS